MARAQPQTCRLESHALRFILPNALIRHYIYVRPGTHSTGSTSGPATAPPYLVRMRLKASKDISGMSAGAQVIAQALKKYGMILADGGNITFTATTDALTTHAWAEVGVDANSLTGLSWNDFEVPELGTRINWDLGSCTRTPITQRRGHRRAVRTSALDSGQVEEPRSAALRRAALSILR